jgi:hypothetical protein
MVEMIKFSCAWQLIPSSNQNSTLKFKLLQSLVPFKYIFPCNQQLTILHQSVYLFQKKLDNSKLNISKFQ